MSHNKRTARHSRIALGFGTAAGASLAAAFMSMGTASAVPGDGTPDPFVDFGVPGGSSLDAFLNSVEPAGAAQWDGFTDHIVATDHDSFADLFGTTNGAPLDTANPVFSANLDPFIDELTEGAQVNDHDAFVDLLGPSGAFLDTAFPGLSVALDPAYDAIKLTDADPFTEIFGAASGAPTDSFLDAIPFGTTNLGAFLDPFADALINAGFAV